MPLSNSDSFKIKQNLQTNRDEKSRHQADLMAQIEDNRRRKEIEKQKEREMDERQRKRYFKINLINF